MLGTLRVDWDPAAYPHVMVRKPGTGAVLANTEAPGREALVTSAAKELDLLLSDGVHTTTRRITVAD